LWFDLKVTCRNSHLSFFKFLNSYTVEDLGSVQVEVSAVAVRNGGASVEVTYGEEKKSTRLKMPLTWLAVFDGHGGDKASQYCADWLSSYVRNEDCFPFDLGFAMKKAFTNIDEDFVHTGYPDGTTACAVSLVGGKRIVCANAGDSRAIVVRKDGSVVRLSRDHKPGMPDETKRITDLGVSFLVNSCCEALFESSTDLCGFFSITGASDLLG
jgi:Protein phosphatase 2C